MFNSYRLRFFFILLSCTAGLYCTNGLREKKDQDPTVFYLDYQVSGDEELDVFTVKIEYHIGGLSGPSVELPASSKVELDGVVLPLQRSKLGGPYYEGVIAGEKFAGEHLIEMKNGAEGSHRQDFSFERLDLRWEMADTINRDSLVVEVEGLEKRDRVGIVLTDTSFYSKGIDRVDSVTDGRLYLGRADLSTLRTGPIQMALFREKERAVEPSGGYRGRILFTYSLRRSFFLQD